METTHKLIDGRYVQLVSPSRLREMLDADGETYEAPDGFGDQDEWTVEGEVSKEAVR